ncbi:MAG: MaoC family dehydratase [Rhodobacteraceae bacterium]|mgnify:CR=1 FL=1|jgi:acyl dehydratase|nr:MaoC family dehydratase [Paracoccaceae bacterium]
MTPPLWFDDLQVGMAFRTPGATLTDDAIIRFAMEWDYQTFHADAHAARQSLFGGLVASGLHTLVMSFRLYNEASIVRGTALAGTGIENLRWLRPARPGDTLSVEVTITGLRPSSRPDRGHVRQRFETRDQNGELLLRFEVTSIVARDPCGSPVVGSADQAPS